MQEGGLDGGGFGAGGLHHGGLEGTEGNFIDEPFSATWAAWFPCHKGAVCYHAQDGHAAVAEHGGGVFYGDAARRWQLFGFHRGYCNMLF